MNINNLLSIPIYEFQCADEILVEEVVKQATSRNFIKSSSNNISVNDHFYNSKLFDWFDQCIAQVGDMYYKDSVSLPIISCWVTKTSKLERHHTHSHPNSILSGIFYLTSHDKAETVFYYKNPYVEMGTHEILRTSNTLNKHPLENPTIITGKINPVKGKLVLFASSIQHGTRPNLDSNIRYTVSFNTFFSGAFEEITENGGLTTGLNLQPVTVRQQFENTSI